MASMSSKSTVILDRWSTSGGTQVLKSDLVNILVAKKGVTQKQAEATVVSVPFT